MNNKLKDIFIIVVICSFIGVFRSFIVNDVEIIKSQNPQITFIDTALCYDKFTEGKSLFIDARDSVSYFKEHIKSSINQREAHMEWVRTGNRIYVKPNPDAPKRGGKRIC